MILIIQTSNWLTIKIKQMAARHLECSHTAADPEEASHWSDLTQPGLWLAVITLSNDHDIKGWLAQAQGIISSSSLLTTLTTHSHTSDQQNIIRQKTRPNIIRSTNNGGKPILGTIVYWQTHSGAVMSRQWPDVVRVWCCVSIMRRPGVSSVTKGSLLPGHWAY